MQQPLVSGLNFILLTFHSCCVLQVIKRALRAESLKELGILDSGASMNSLSSQHSSALFFGSGLTKGAAGGGVMAAAVSAPSKEDDEDVSDMQLFFSLF